MTCLESQGWWQIWDRKVVVSLGTEIPEQPPPPPLSPPDQVLDFWTKGYPPSIPQIFLPQSCCQDIESAGAKRRAYASTQTFQSLTQKLYFPERTSLNRSGGKSLLLPHHHTSAASRQTGGLTSGLLDSYVAQSPGFSKPTCTYNSSLMNQLGLQDPTLDEPLINEESDLMDWCFAGLIDEADMSSTVFWPLIWAIVWAGRAYTLSEDAFSHSPNSEVSTDSSPSLDLAVAGREFLPSVTKCSFHQPNGIVPSHHCPRQHPNTQ